LERRKITERNADTRLRGMGPKAYRIRSERFTVPATKSFEEAVDRRLRIKELAPAKYDRQRSTEQTPDAETGFPPVKP
jgi:hypothetical protein